LNAQNLLLVFLFFLENNAKATLRLMVKFVEWAKKRRSNLRLFKNIMRSFVVKLLINNVIAFPTLNSDLLIMNASDAFQRVNTCDIQY